MRSKLGLLLLLLVFLAGCTEGKTDIKDEAAETEGRNVKMEYIPGKSAYYKMANPPRRLTEMEEELLRVQGEFSGDAYDEEGVNKHLAVLPDTLKADQYLEEMLFILAEDYHEETETFVNTGSSTASAEEKQILIRETADSVREKAKRESERLMAAHAYLEKSLGSSVTNEMAEARLLIQSRYKQITAYVTWQAELFE